MKMNYLTVASKCLVFAILAGMFFSSPLRADEQDVLVCNFDSGPGKQDEGKINKIKTVADMRYSYIDKGSYNDSSYSLMFENREKGKRGWLKLAFFDHDTDVSEYKTLSLWVKSEKAGNSFKIYFKSSVDDPASEPSKNDRKNIGPFMEEGITTEWQHVRIPVKEMTRGINKKKISHLMFQVDDDCPPTKFYVDDIKFQDTPVKKKTWTFKMPYTSPVIENAESHVAEKLIKKAGIKGGLIVYHGAEDGKTISALHINEHFIVHGLCLDKSYIGAVKEYINDNSLQHSVSVSPMSRCSERLPYIDNLVNFFISKDIGNIPRQEIIRILRPGGKALIKDADDEWEMVAKPYPVDIGDWTHLMCNSGGNPVADDKVVGQPKRLQWKAGKEWDRQHDWIKSVTCMVSGRGRLFYNVDDATSADMHVPPKWSIVARDAFNGTLLWKRPMKGWSKWGKRNKYHPMALHRSIVADNEKDLLYLWLTNNGPVSALNAATGETVRTYKTTKGAEAIIYNDGILYVVTGKVDGKPMSTMAFSYSSRLNKGYFPNRKTIHAVDSVSGKELWKWTDSAEMPYFPNTLAVGGNGVYMHVGNKVYKLDRKSGKIVWKTQTNWIIDPKNKCTKNPRIAGTTMVVDGHVLDVSQVDRKLRVLNAENGKLLWEMGGINGNLVEPPEIFVIERTVWTRSNDYRTGYEISTGKVEAHTPGLDAIASKGHHDRCYRAKATSNYILGRHRGLELIDVTGKNRHSRNNWARGTCRLGVIPANGLIYTPPHSCACYWESKLVGLHALAPGKETNSHKKDDKYRLEKGPLYGKVECDKSLLYDSRKNEWPTFRQDNLRSGVIDISPPRKLESVKWKTEPLSNPTAPVAAGGRLFVAEIDKCKILAFNSESGEKIWEFTAGGRIDSPPTVHGNLLLFGSKDGFVYCLSASDGELIWRFMGAPYKKKTVVNNRIESLWPIPGSILIYNNIAYFAAGRNAYLDGGIYLWGLDPATGNIKASCRIEKKHETWNSEIQYKNKIKTKKYLSNNYITYKTVYGKDHSDAFSMEGARNDVLVSNGNSIFMKQLGFDPSLKETKKRATHLFATSGLLDREGNHRAHWVLGSGDTKKVQSPNLAWTADRVDGRNPHTSKGNRFLSPVGRILCYDENNAYTVQQIGGNRPYFGRFAICSRPHKGINTGNDPGKDLGKESDTESIKRNWITETENIYPVSILKSGNLLIVSGPSNRVPYSNPWKSYEGDNKGYICYYSQTEGKLIQQKRIASPPIWDGVIVTKAGLFFTSMDGRLNCIAE